VSDSGAHRAENRVRSDIRRLTNSERKVGDQAWRAETKANINGSKRIAGRVRNGSAKAASHQSDKELVASAIKKQRAVREDAISKDACISISKYLQSVEKSAEK